MAKAVKKQEQLFQGVPAPSAREALQARLREDTFLLTFSGLPNKKASTAVTFYRWKDPASSASKMAELLFIVSGFSFVLSTLHAHLPFVSVLPRLPHALAPRPQPPGTCPWHPDTHWKILWSPSLRVPQAFFPLFVFGSSLMGYPPPPRFFSRCSSCCCLGSLKPPASPIFLKAFKSINT